MILPYEDVRIQSQFHKNCLQNWFYKYTFWLKTVMYYKISHQIIQKDDL